MIKCILWYFKIQKRINKLELIIGLLRYLRNIEKLRQEHIDILNTFIYVRLH